MGIKENTTTSKDYDVYSWLFRELLQKLKQNFCDKAVLLIETEDGVRREFSTGTIRKPEEFISSFCEE